MGTNFKDKLSSHDIYTHRVFDCVVDLCPIAGQSVMDYWGQDLVQQQLLCLAKRVSKIRGWTGIKNESDLIGWPVRLTSKLLLRSQERGSWPANKFCLVQ